MKSIWLTFFVCFCFSYMSIAQTKSIPNQEITPGGGVYFEAVMNASQISISIQGPADRWFAIALGSAMSDGDAIIYTDGKVGAMHALGVWDYDLNAQNAAGVVKDIQNDWTLVSNTTNAGLRTIEATRNLNTGDPIDHVINFNNTTINLIWAKGSSASNTLSYHGSGNRGSATLTWVVPDITPPSALNPFSPADNATNVSLSANAVINFNENIAFGTGNIELHLLSNGSLVEQYNVASSPNLSINASQLTINPSANFNNFTEYYITIASGAITDVAGNSYAGFTNNTTWNFLTIDNTADVTPPNLSITPFSPNDNANSVPLNANLLVNFNENVQLAIGNITLYRLSDNLIIETFNAASSPNLSVNLSQLTINPSVDLLSFTEYYVTIAAGAITDLSNNSYSGFTNNSTWNFIAIDAAPPVLSVSPFSPIDNAVSVSLNADLLVNFNENIQLSTGNIVLYRFVDNVIIESFDASSSPNLSVVSNQLTINPSADLSSFTEYYVTIVSGPITDLNGNSYLGFTDNTTWNFVTSDVVPPNLAIVPFYPEDNAVSVPLDANLIVNFNENVLAAVGNITLFRLSDDVIIESFDVSSSPLITINGAEVTIDPTNNLSLDTEYYVTIDQGSFVDYNNNSYSGFTDNSTWNFSSLTSGIDELSNYFTLEMLPNASVSITNTFEEHAFLKVFSLSGQILFEKELTQGKQKIDLEKFRNMSVLVIISCEEGQISKLIKL